MRVTVQALRSSLMQLKAHHAAIRALSASLVPFAVRPEEAAHPTQKVQALCLRCILADLDRLTAPDEWTGLRDDLAELEIVFLTDDTQ